jgi:hypothetical protein
MSNACQQLSISNRLRWDYLPDISNIVTIQWFIEKLLRRRGNLLNTPSWLIRPVSQCVGSCWRRKRERAQ